MRNREAKDEPAENGKGMSGGGEEQIIHRKNRVNLSMTSNLHVYLLVI